MKKKPELDDILSKWSVWTIGNTGKALLIALLITAIMSVGFIFLSMEMTFYSMMPKNSGSAADLEKIVDEFPMASSISVVIEGSDPVKLRQAVDAVTRELKKDKYSQEIVDVKGKIDFRALENRILYLSATEKGGTDISLDEDPVELVSYLNSEITKTLNKDNLTWTEKERVNSQLAALEEILESALAGPDSGDAQEKISGLFSSSFLPDPYFINRDQTMALVFVLPSFTMNDFFTLAPSILKIEDGVKQFEEEFNVSIGLTGMIVVGKDEAVTSESGLAVSFIAAFALIILLLIINFRMKSVPLIAGIPLIMGIWWTAGLTGFLLGRLNLMTAMYLVALMGLGIDFAIHFMTAFMHEREDGKDFKDSIAEGVRKSGRGIVVGALTTSVAFLALIIARSDLVRELAVVAGTGILAELLAMFIILPALLSIRQKRKLRKGKPDLMPRKKFKLSVGGPVSLAISRAPLAVFIIFAAAAVVLGCFSHNVKVETNLMNMEAAGLESVELQDRMVEKFDMSPDGLNIMSGSVEETRALAEKLEKLDAVSSVDSVAAFLPSVEEQQKLKNSYEKMINQMAAAEQAPVVDMQALQAFIQGTEELSDNLVRLAAKAGFPGKDRLKQSFAKITGDIRYFMQLDSYMSAGMEEYIRKQISADFITEKTAPESLTSGYFSSDKKYNLITIIPKENLWVEENRLELYKELKPVTDKATGLIMVADQMTQIAQKDGVTAAIAALIAIFFILIIDFRNVKLTIMTMLPLAAAMFSLFGIMAILKIRFDFMNIIAVPLLIGIGIDDAIHLSHRYRLEGPGSIVLVINRIGKAILMTTLTTIIGFASFIPSVMRAMSSTGVVISMALALAFIYSIFMHSALLVLVKEKLGLSLDSWGSRRKK